MKSIRVEAERTYEVIFAKANRVSLEAALSGATRIALIVPEELKHFADALASELTHDEKLEKVVVITVGEGESQRTLRPSHDAGTFLVRRISDEMIWSLG